MTPRPRRLHGAFALLLLIPAAPAAAGPSPGTAPGTARASAPRVVAAAMVDTDGDDRADRVVLTYSRRISHARDTRRFPFTVAGYRIVGIDRATRSTSLVIRIAEGAAADIAARPRVTYRPTRQQPVLAGRTQAARQTFTATRPLDLDLDGAARLDCAPTDPAVHPGALDHPDLAGRDTDCDGRDGTESASIHVSPTGDDAGDGSRTAPVATLTRALALVTAQRTDVLLALGDFASPAIDLPGGVGLYGSFDPTTWTRDPDTGGGGSVVTLAGRVRLQGGNAVSTLWFTSTAPGATVAVTGPAVTLERVTALHTSTSGGNAIALLVTPTGAATVTDSILKADDAGNGTPGTPGTTGAAGGTGAQGQPGACDNASYRPVGGAGGTAPTGGFSGGAGGDGGWAGSQPDPFFADDGAHGGGYQDQPPYAGRGGTGGNWGSDAPPADGVDGNPGRTGTAGAVGPTLLGTFGPAGYAPRASGTGGTGAPGTGGGGGGGGGGGTGVYVVVGGGIAGGGGGAGGAGGTGGTGGTGGYASVAAYVYQGSLTLDGVQLISGEGGDGGAGGTGGAGGAGGQGAAGRTACPAEVGDGGDGGDGGTGGVGGAGGHGQGGHSLGIVDVGATISAPDVTFSLGSAGFGSGGLVSEYYVP
ncbi:hypothetical protein [Nocardioides sp.]|uniref:hypothetical protein n=1 Tax=Nocardioides sp. TaxID=35761 RepID=UPI0035170B8E